MADGTVLTDRGRQAKRIVGRGNSVARGPICRNTGNFDLFVESRMADRNSASDAATGDERCCAHPRDGAATLFPARDYITGDRFEIVRCGHCGATRTEPAPSREEMARYYPAEYYRQSGRRRFPAIVEFLQRRLYSGRARTVERLLGGRKGEVVDVGCGPGWLLNAFRARGWKTRGTELSESAAEFARDVMGLSVESRELGDMEGVAGRFDAAVLWHVLEHHPDPGAQLRETARALKPGGVLLVGVPNFGCPGSRWSGDSWFALDVPRHLSHLPASRLRGMLKRAGFRVRVERHLAPEYDFFGFAQTLLNRLGLRRNLLYLALKGQRKAALEEARFGGLQLAATLLLAPLLGALSVPVCLAAALFRCGASVTFYAVKESA